MIFVDEKPLRTVEQYRELGNLPLQRLRACGSATATHGFAGADARRTHPAEIDAARRMTGSGSNTRETWCISCSLPKRLAKSGSSSHDTQQAFAPRKKLWYIRIKGLTFQHAGNAFPPPPTADSFNQRRL
jgi:hypothetical protein